ncbi:MULTISPECIES: hypothetical protein [unclassified Microcoleus]|uniref:hypothetical protein n=1 Tax=unclassified Microcoleus TaxID=2642155 RepID=UPI002FD5598B
MQEALEVEIVESNRVETESIRESIRDEWIGAMTAYKLADLTKSSFQRAISHLLGVRGCRVDSIRRGDAKNTRYSRLAIELIKAHKSGDEVRLQQLLELAVNPAISSQPSSLAVVDHIATLETKIANLRQATAANSRLNADRMRSKLAEITRCNQTAQQRNEALNDAELLAAESRGIEQALAIFSAEEAAKENALAHLRALKISGNQ